jgi:hypothetical protein
MLNATALAMVFKLIEAAQRNWRRLDSALFLPTVLYGMKFKDGIEDAGKPACPSSRSRRRLILSASQKFYHSSKALRFPSILCKLMEFRCCKNTHLFVG